MAYEHHRYAAADEQIGNYEEHNNLHEGVEEMRHFVRDVANNPAFLTALQGESGYLARIAEIDTVQQKLKLTSSMLHQSPFIGRMIPSHIVEENHAAFIVAVAEWLESGEEEQRQVA